ncbi:MAG: hypothetical protein ACHBN1_35940 [Heteroscytonema crispum UTEX LB 1556]
MTTKIALRRDAKPPEVGQKYFQRSRNFPQVIIPRLSSNGMVGLFPPFCTSGLPH